ncbi:MAG: ABC transporter ATP-binding protein [Paracholeplasma sp.]|jgi:ABC-2 type transport system ATP-binding protein|uniref:ABC transporter, ATP-binding protein n=1 Tax=Acholeplasma brassicae TaxID=61635 RepID=U4KPE3_9MOLU|nr:MULTISPECIES: ABC transporter ATP-binding protein [Paracholeplasma]MDY3196154.1 ABC transporter ATP-binding protein [Paracholeplasma sp.]CCV66206.1 ABC transporter, ATP-binding protein [Paracholeplasma brassicae]
MNELIKIEALTKNYQRFKALDGVNLQIEKGKIIGLLGPNGSGKTTLIKVITGLLKQYDGKVYIDGKLISYDSKSVISYLPDQLYFDSWMKIKDVKRYFKDMFSDFNVDKFDSLMTTFKIEDRKYIKKLSKGNQEKLQLALILSREAKIYIFDEPIGGVDPALRDTILNAIMAHHTPESTIILSTHQIYDVENLFDQVIFLKEGKVLLHEDLDKVLEASGKSLLETFKEVFRYV